MEYDVKDCPFCGAKECIRTLRFPSVTSEKRTVTASLPNKGAFRRSREEEIFQNGCPKCGKTAEEIEKWYHK